MTSCFARYARSTGETREPGSRHGAAESTRRPAGSPATPRHMNASQSGRPAVGALSWPHCGKGGHPSRRRQGLSSSGSTVLIAPKLGSTASRFPPASDPAHGPVNDHIVRIRAHAYWQGLQVDGFGETSGPTYVVVVRWQSVRSSLSWSFGLVRSGRDVEGSLVLLADQA